MIPHLPAADVHRRSPWEGRSGLDPAAFATPPTEYRAVPFWSWNDRITEEEVVRQIDQFHAAGVGGFFVHARPGIWTPFLSEEWFALFETCVKRAEELGMKVWIYDECSYPSGFAGGLVHDQRPDLAQNVLHCRLVEETSGQPTSGEEQVLGRFWLFRNAAGRTDYKPAFDSRPPSDDAKLIEFRVVPHPGIPWLNGRPYIDVLHPEAADAFLAVAYEPYRERFGHHFGRLIPGVFTDEPHFEPFHVGDPHLLTALPWTPDLPAVYAEWYGDDLLSRLPELVIDTAHRYRSRVRFWRLLSLLFVERWMRPIYEWCDRYGLLFTGHFWEHGFRPDYTGDLMLPTAWQHIPGIDLLGRDRVQDRLKWDLGERGAYGRSPEQMGNIAMVKAVTSVAHQLGRSRVMSETYGAAGWELDFEKQKVIAEWQAVLGVNLLVPHLSHYSLRGERKHEHPPSFLAHQPWWPEYPAVHEYLSRLHYTLSQGAYEADLVVLHPMSSLWLARRASRQPVPDIANPDHIPSNLQARLKLELDDLLKDLEAAGFSYDMGAELMLEDIGCVDDGRLRIGEMSYGVVVVPPMLNLSKATLDLLRRFVEAGGALAVVGSAPQFVDGERDPALAALLERCLRFPDSKGLLAWLPTVASRKARLEANDHNAVIYTHVRRVDEGRLVFAVNMGPTSHKEAALRISILGDGAERVSVERLDLRDGTSTALPYESLVDGEMGPCVEVLLDFAEGESHLILVRSTLPQNAAGSLGGGDKQTSHDRGRRVQPSSRPIVVSGTSNTGRHTPRQVDRRLVLEDRWAFRRLDPNALVLDRCAYRLEGPQRQEGPWSEVVPLPALKRLLRRRYGWPEITFREVQPWRKYADEAPAPVDEVTRLRFTAQIAFDPGEASQLELVVEEAEEWEIAVNGRRLVPSGEWWIDPALRRIPAQEALRQGENIIELARRFREDMSFEPIYLIGDFAVAAWDMRTFRLEREVPTLPGGSWVYRGYPFYAGRAVYAQEIELTIDKGERVWLELSDLPASAAHVRVNGEAAGLVAWQPYSVEITPLVRTGANTIEIEVVNSLRNLFGPHYKYGPIALVTPGHWFYDLDAGAEMSVVPDGLAGQVCVLVGR